MTINPLARLALRQAAWHWRRMTDPNPREPRAAGGFLAMAILGGVVIGLILDQPTIGFLVGLAVGLAIMLGLWVADRGREGR